MGVLQSANRAVAAAALLAFAAGCSKDSTAPNAPFDASGTSADVSAIDESFDSPAAAAFATASVQISNVVEGVAGAAIRSIPSAAVARDGKAGAFRYSAALAKRYRANGPSLSAAAIPAEYLGSTFVYDVDTDSYVESDLSGAPVNGVRFLLYAVNPVTEVPVEPLVEIGHADIVTTETASSATVHITVVSGGVTYLDYAVAAAASGMSAVQLDISGFATNGTDRVNFDLENTLTGSEEAGLGLTIDYLMVVPTRGGFRVDIEGSTTGYLTETTTTTIALQARGGHGTVRVEGSATNGAGSFDVEVNGDLFATITVTGDAFPTVVGADGQPLSDEEANALQAVWLLFAGAGDFFEDLVDPAL